MPFSPSSFTSPAPARAGIPRPPSLRPAVAGWTALAVVLSLTVYLIVRSCGYDVTIPARYFAYFILQIALPGCVLLYLIGLRPLSFSTLVALGLPTGFAIEIISFLALSAAGVRALQPSLPLVWIVLGLMRYRSRRDLQWNWKTTPPIGVALALGALFLGTVLIAASQMFAESPIIDGLPQRPLFHDWVYLLSRAAVLKHQWPIEEPSLAGTPLQYHYFLLVHVAAASCGAHLDVTWILLRLVVIPLGLILVVQTYALGKLICRSRWGGVLASFLTLLPGELSQAADYAHLTFLGLFLRWLYLSPTFFFGVIFFGALLLAGSRRLTGWRQMLWLVLLAAVATAAKGSILPVLITGLVIAFGWGWIREGRLPASLIVTGMLFGTAFAGVYLLTMSEWGTAGVLFQPFEICHITSFWDEWAIPCQRFLKRELHAPDFGTWLGAAFTTSSIIIGSAGIRLLALPYVFRPKAQGRAQITRWLAANAAASYLLGVFFHFDANSELYFLLLARLPTAVLAAAFVVDMIDRRWPQRIWASAGWRGWSFRIAAGCGAIALSLGLLLQITNTVLCHRQGFAEWLRFGPTTKINADLVPLYDTMAWIRQHTEPNAVLLTNVFTAKNLRSGRGVLVDHTTAGVYYYFSALSERRLWIEGPSYLLDQVEARRRLLRSAEVFYYHKAPPRSLFSAGPGYILLDHSLADEASFSAPNAKRVFSNQRFEVFCLTAPTPTPPFATAAN